MPPCVDVSAETKWLNQADVKAALHVNTQVTWAVCSDVLNYNTTLEQVLDLHKELAPHYHVLIYSGDADGMVPYTGTQRWIHDWSMPLVHPRTPWQFVEPGHGRQIGGNVERWQYLTYAIVRAAGHMVPQVRLIFWFLWWILASSTDTSPLCVRT